MTGPPIRFGPEFRFWVVVDATPNSELSDVLFQASLADLELQFRGGLTMESRPTLFLDRAHAEREACVRLIAMRATRVLADHVTAGGELRDARSIVVRDAEGHVLFEGEL